MDQDRSKYTDVERDDFEEWIVTKCDQVIENLLKNDMIWMRDRKGKVVQGDDNLPKKIQKWLLMSSYWELHLYMIENFQGMMTDGGDIWYSESTIRRIMPKNIKKAGERYKQMCGCQT